MAMTPKMRVPQAAAYLGISVSTLNKMRCYGGGPFYYKAGSRVVLYDRADLDSWLESSMTDCTGNSKSRKAAET